MNANLCVVLCLIFFVIGFLLGYLVGHIDERNYWRSWTESFGVGEYYLGPDHTVKFGLKKDCK